MASLYENGANGILADDMVSNIYCKSKTQRIYIIGYGKDRASYIDDGIHLRVHRHQRQASFGGSAKIHDQQLDEGVRQMGSILQSGQPDPKDGSPSGHFEKLNAKRLL